MAESLEKRPAVLVTGFEIFGEHVVNASWAAVQMLPSMGVDDEFNVRLVIDELPVKYAYIPTYLRVIWEELKPHVS
jgi:pyrrolidone-carboxylate peptidase